MGRGIEHGTSLRIKAKQTAGGRSTLATGKHQHAFASMELRGDGGRVTCAPFVPGLPNLSPVLHVKSNSTDVIPAPDIQDDARGEDERRRTKSEKVRRHLIFRGEIAFPKNASISEVETMEQAGNSKNKDALTIDNRIRPWTLT